MKCWSSKFLPPASAVEVIESAPCFRLSVSLLVSVSWGLSIITLDQCAGLFRFHWVCRLLGLLVYFRHVYDQDALVTRSVCKCLRTSYIYITLCIILSPSHFSLRAKGLWITDAGGASTLGRFHCLYYLWPSLRAGIMFSVLCVCLFVWVYWTNTVHHHNSTELPCGPLSCLGTKVHHGTQAFFFSNSTDFKWILIASNQIHWISNPNPNQIHPYLKVSNPIPNHSSKIGFVQHWIKLWCQIRPVRSIALLKFHRASLFLWIFLCFFLSVSRPI